MECLSCKVIVSNDAFFCSNCGKKLRCVICNSELSPNAKFCSKCGESVIEMHQESKTKNLAKYHRKGEEIFCEVSLNDEVAKDGIVSLFDNLTKSQQIRQLPYNENKDDEVFDKPEAQPTQTSAGTDNFIKDHSKTIEVSEMKSEYPHIKDLENSLECSEKDWILIYAFYESHFGANNFTKQKVYDRYMLKRKTNTRIKNFAAYWKRVYRDYLRTINDNDLRFKQDVLDDVKNLVIGKRKSLTKGSPTPSKPRKTTSEDQGSTKTGTVSKTKAIEVEKFDIYKSGETISLQDFIKEKSPGKSALNNIAVIGYYITKVRGAKTFSEGNIDYAYRTLSINGRPKFLHQIMINAKNKQDYFEQTTINSVWTLTRGGEIFVEEKLPSKPN